MQSDSKGGADERRVTLSIDQVVGFVLYSIRTSAHLAIEAGAYVMKEAGRDGVEEASKAAGDSKDGRRAISPTRLKSIEKGSARVSVWEVWCLCRVYGIDVAALINKVAATGALLDHAGIDVLAVPLRQIEKGQRLSASRLRDLISSLAIQT